MSLSLMIPLGRRNLAVATLIAGLTWLVGGLGAQAAAGKKTTSFPLSVQDDLGRKVTFAQPPKRIISLAAGYTETLYALGVQDRIVATDNYSDYPLESRAKTKLNCWPHPPMEQLVALKPDLILSFVDSTDSVQQMEKLHLPVLKFFPGTFDGTLQLITQIGRLTGVEARADTLVSGIRRRAAAVDAKLKGVQPKSVLCEVDGSDPAKPYVVGGTGFYSEIIHRAGGRNIFADVKGPSAQVNVELVIARKPEVLLTGNPQHLTQPELVQKIAARPGWSTLPAVRSGQVFSVGENSITRPGPRLIQGLEQVAKLLHPERFR